MKKLLKLTYLFLFFAIPFYTKAEPSQTTPSINEPLANTTKQKSPIPELLKLKIKSDINKIYGDKDFATIYSKVIDVITNIKKERPRDLRLIDVSESPTWYKNQITYMFYADNFGITQRGKPNTFRETIKMVPYLTRLGITNVYILPFLDSPMKDSGFDVKGPTTIRPDLGTMSDFRRFVNQLHKNGIRVTADLVLNHLSDQSSWFVQALNGNPEKINFFLHKDYLPPNRTYRDPFKGIVIDYTNTNGSVSSRRLIFPELTTSHYRKEIIKGKAYYFYHTFYPSQIDLNWENPAVLYAMLKNIGFWCNQGIDIFRLDAIPFLIKDDGSDGENAPKTHAIVNLISSFVQASCPNTVLQAEAGQSPLAILPYFGKEESYVYSDLNREILITRTDEVQIAYNFPLMPALWASMIFYDSNYFWKVYNNLPTLPNSATWANFLRVHDELTLETADPGIRNSLHDKLIKNGSEFRQGLGVSGRMANFLYKDYRRINQAFAILLSLPDSPIIYYGDEIGALNNWDFARHKAYLRQKAATKKHSSIASFFDSRDINRGPVAYQSFENAVKSPTSYGGRIYASLKRDIMLRKIYPALKSEKLSKVTPNRPEVMAYLRGNLTDSILVINNLSANQLEAQLEVPIYLNASQITFLDLRSKKTFLLNFRKGQTVISLKPYQTLWLIKLQ